MLHLAVRRVLVFDTRYRYFYFTNQTDVKGEKTAIFALTRFVKKTGSLFYELRSRLFLFLLILKKHSSCKASSHTYPLHFQFLVVCVSFSSEYLKFHEISNQKNTRKRQIVFQACACIYKSSALPRRRDKHTPARTNKLQENEMKSNASFAADPLGESTQFFFDIQKFSFYALNRNCYFPIGNVYAFFRLSAQRKDNLHL